jgi:hypothetical protein
VPTEGSHSDEPAPWQRTRWGLATLVVTAWLALYIYWLLRGSVPACHIARVIHTNPSSIAVTRSCGLPDATGYIYVLAVAAFLVLPDAKKINIGPLGIERREVAAVLNMGDALKTGGEDVRNARPAKEVLGQYLPAPGASAPQRRGSLARMLRSVAEKLDGSSG